MAVRCGAGHGKSGAPLARGCFLLFLLLLLLLLDEARALAARQPDLVSGNISVKFRGARSASMHPTVTSFSPPNVRRRQPSQHLRGGSSSSSSFMPPGVVSRAPSTRSQVPSPAAPAITPAPRTPRTHTWASRAGSSPPQPTVIGFGLDGATPLRPAKWNSPQASHTIMEGGGGWAGMNTPAVQGKWLSPTRPQHTPDLTDSARPNGRPDTFGLSLSEDLSHLHDRPSGWRQTVTVVGKSPVNGRDRAGSRGTTRTVFNGGSRQTHLWPIEEEMKDEEEVDDEGGGSLFDFNATAEYQPDDYSAYHEYDHSNTSWRSPEQTPSPVHDQGILTFEHVIEIQNLTSQANLHALLEQRGITFDELRDFLNNGARKKDVLEFLKPPTPSTTTTTAPSQPVLSHSPNMPDISAVEEDYQDDVTRQASLPATEIESEDDDTDLESKERSRKNKKKGRRGKGGRRRKNKKRKGKKGQKEDASDVGAPLNPQVDNSTETPAPDLLVPSTPRTLPEMTFTTTTTTKNILLPITQPPTPDTLTTLPSSVRTSDVSIVSVTLVEAPSDPQPEIPGQTTFVEGVTPSRRQNTHSTTNLWEERNPRKTLRPARPSPEPEQTITETEEINFVREKQRDDYVFPLRGLLIISGLMGALAVFTLVVLISYAVIKCSKKPVVNNYQVSEQQKPAGT